MPGALALREGGLALTVEIGEGQKSGTFLDLRGLRKYVAAQKLNGERVLNLFSYTGTWGWRRKPPEPKKFGTSISLRRSGSAKKNHQIAKTKQKYVEADVFEWFGQLDAKKKFDLIIIDPPLMASNTKQVPGALKAYRRLYQSAIGHLASKGKLVVCCCTSRIARKRFLEEAKSAMPPRMTLKTSLAPEDDHPVGFSEGDYLKMLVFQSGPPQKRR